MRPLRTMGAQGHSGGHLAAEAEPQGSHLDAKHVQRGGRVLQPRAAAAGRVRVARRRQQRLADQRAHARLPTPRPPTRKPSASPML